MHYSPVLVAVWISGSRTRSRDDPVKVPPGTFPLIVSHSLHPLRRDSHQLLRKAVMYMQLRP